MNIEITQPEGYDFGAWQAIIKLDDAEKEIVKERPLVFKIPRLNYRNILSDDGYRMPGFVNDEVTLGGIFKDGIWCGHVYSNGIAEEKNPVSIDSVKIGLEERIKQSIEFGYFFGAIAGNTNYFDHFKKTLPNLFEQHIKTYPIGRRVSRVKWAVIGGVVVLAAMASPVLGRGLLAVLFKV